MTKKILEPTPERTTRTQALRALARLATHPRALARTTAAIARGAREGGVLGFKAMLRETARAGEIIDYDTFVAREQASLAGGGATLRAHLAKVGALPSISVVANGAHTLAGQIQEPLELVASERAARGDYILTLHAGDRLPPHALAAFALAAAQRPDAPFLFSDHDRLDNRGKRVAPSFKPSWSPELFEAQDYVGPSRLVRRGAAPTRSAPVHLPSVLYHSAAPAAQSAAVRGCSPPLPAATPLVTIIIPTRDRAELLRRCVGSLRAHTQYAGGYELLVVDNGSREPEALAYLTELERGGATLLRDERPFHFGALNNAAVARAKGELVVLLNNDVEITHASWLRELVAYAARPAVGAVGAKLLYPSGRVQHAGVVLGMHGVAGHVFKGLRADAPGYGGWACLPRNVSAVTAACLAIRRDVYLGVGGFNEGELAVEYGDVDFCLRVLEAGYRNVFTPHAVLVHHESGSRGRDETAESRARGRAEYAAMVRRYGARLSNDPFWNPNLSLCTETVALANPPRSVAAR